MALLPPQPHRVFAGLVGLFFYPLERCSGFFLALILRSAAANVKEAVRDEYVLLVLPYLGDFSNHRFSLVPHRKTGTFQERELVGIEG